MASFSVSVLVARFAAVWDDHQFVAISFPSSFIYCGEPFLFAWPRGKFLWSIRGFEVVQVFVDT